MYFKPIDEMSLRHLATSRYGEEVLKCSYLGPILNPSGEPVDSPDCLLLDRRGKEYKILRCEFKYAPQNHTEFRCNGEFDIAICWQLGGKGLTKEDLKRRLEEQNKCREIIVLSSDYQKEFSGLFDYKEFHDKPGREQEEILQGIRKLTDRIKKMGRVYPLLFIAYIAAKISPETFSRDKMNEVLVRKRIIKTKPKAKGVYIAALNMTNIIKHMYDEFYCWNECINPHSAIRIIQEVFVEKLKKPLPDSDTINWVKSND